MKQLIIPPIIVIILLFNSYAAFGVNVQSLRVDAFINPDKTIHNVFFLDLDEPVAHYELDIKFKISNLTVRSSYQSADCKIIYIEVGSKISCDFIGIPPNNELRIDFDSSGDIKNINETHQLSINYDISIPVTNKIIAIRLPEGSILAKEPADMSFHPKDGEVFSDGRRIGILWKINDHSKPAQFLILYSQTIANKIPDSQIGFFGTIIVVILVISAIIIFYLRKSMAIGKTEIFKTVLNKDENRIVDILTRNEGKVYQKMLVRETDFSKAKVSRLVKGLRERGVIDIEPVSGRENRVILRLEKKEEKQNENKEQTKGQGP